MELDPNQFLETATIALHDIQLQSALERGTGNAVRNRLTAMGELPHSAELRQQGRGGRLRGLADLPELLERFERNITANGAKVLWAEDAAEANRHVLDILLSKKLKLGVVDAQIAQGVGHILARRLRLLLGARLVIFHRNLNPFLLLQIVNIRIMFFHHRHSSIIEMSCPKPLRKTLLQGCKCASVQVSNLPISNL